MPTRGNNRLDASTSRCCRASFCVLGAGYFSETKVCISQLS